MDQSEMRLDPLTGAWTIFPDSRALRPSFRSVRDEAEAPDPFARGRERFAPHTLHEARGQGGWQVRVVPNRSPILRIEGDASPRADGFYDHMEGVGAHEVVIEDPGDQALEELPLGSIEKVITAWKTRMLDLMRDPRLRAFFVIKNVGAPAGGLVRHSVSQVVAMALIPPTLRHRLKVAREFFASKQRSIFEDILAEEIRIGTRLVYENNGFAVFCPYASRSPFEMSIFPKRQCADFPGCSDQERSQLADVLHTALGKLNRALDYPPYNFILHTAPSRTAGHTPDHDIDLDFRWHMEIVPRLHHAGGIEVATGCSINGVRPEIAAEELRQAEVTS
jgi:UDPglucose--hexose-1-phosphate uridylyltransferase